MENSTLFLLIALVIYAAGSALDIFSSLGFEKYGLHETNKLMADKDGNFAEKRNTVGTLLAAVAALIIWTLVTDEYKYSVAGCLAGVGLWRTYEAIRNWRAKHRFIQKRQSRL